MNVLIVRLGHGFFDGCIVIDIAPSITTSCWEHNNLILLEVNL